MSLKQINRRIAQIPIMDTATVEQAETTIRNATDKTNFLILPALFREFETGQGQQSAMQGILPTLKKADYVDHIVIGLDAADEAQYKQVLKLIEQEKLPQKVHVIWNNAPKIEAWRSNLASQEVEGRPLAPATPGKGRNVWGCAAYINAIMQENSIDPKNANIAMHDCDITTYDELMVAKLFQPLCLKDGDGEPSSIEYVKANFVRNTDETLNARVTRMFGPAFIDSVQNSLQDLDGYNEELRDLLEYMRSFQYMFSGEMAFNGDVLNQIELPNDYSLEIRILQQVHEILPTQPGDAPRIADVEIAGRYDHHHQGLDGLKKMVTQIAAAGFEIAGAKFPLTQDVADTVQAKYLKRGTSLPTTFNMIASMNGLTTNPEKEMATVEEFAEMIPEAFEMYANSQIEKPSHSLNELMIHTPDATGALFAHVKDLGGQINGSPQLPKISYSVTYTIGENGRTIAPSNDFGKIPDDAIGKDLSEDYSLMPKVIPIKQSNSR